MANYRFVINQPVDVEETRHYEFKEVKGGRPLDTIKNTCDEYIVAFLNSEGGRIFWGIRDSDRSAVGVSLTSTERDELRRVVTEKLNQIQPPISPTAYQINLYSVYENGNSNEIVENQFIIEIVAPRVFSDDLYSTGGGAVFVKTDGGKRKLTFQEIQDEIRRRHSQKQQLSSAPVGEVKVNDEPCTIVLLHFAKDGSLSNDPVELQASLAEALYAANNDEAVEFALSYEALEIIKSAIASIDAENITPEDRLTKVRLLELAKDYERRLERFEAAANLLFQKPVRDYFYLRGRLAESIEGLAMQTISDNLDGSHSTGIDIFSQDGTGMSAVFHLSQEEVEEVKSHIEINNIYQLMGNFGYDFNDLPQSIQYKKALPAVLLEAVRIRKKLNSLDLQPILNLNSWYIGLH